MINKYTELHERFLELIAEYHNAHITFINKPNVWNAVPVGSVLMDMDRMIRELKKNNLAMRKQMHAEVKAKKAAKLKGEVK